jgi:hypothetical protein
LLAHFEGALFPSLFVLENTLDKQVVEVFQTGEAPKSLPALGNLVVGVQGVE